MLLKVSKLSCKGTVSLYKNGQLVRVVPNLVVNGGIALTASLLVGSGTAPSHAAIGTGTTEPQVTDTALAAEYARGSASRSLTTTAVTDDTAVFEREFSFTEEVSITESGLFNASSSGTLFSRATFTAVPLKYGDILLIRWKVQSSWA